MAEERRSCIFPIVVGYGTRGARIKTYQIKGHFQKLHGKKITLALLYINYERSLNLIEAIKTSRLCKHFGLIW